MQHDEGTMGGGIFRCVGGTMDCSVTKCASLLYIGCASLRSALLWATNLKCGDAGYPGNLDGTGATREISRATSTGRYPKILTYQIQTTCLHSALGFRSFISYLIILSCKNRIACRWRTLGAVLLLLLRRHVTPQLIHVIYEFLPEWRC